jgi:hypothetical protein
VLGLLEKRIFLNDARLAVTCSSVIDCMVLVAA